MADKDILRTDGYTVDPDKFIEAHEQVSTLLDSIFGTDFEESSNVQFVLVDRQRCWPMHYVPELYGHNCETEDDYLQMMDRVLLNLQIAADNMNRIIKGRVFWKANKKQ